MKFPEKATLNYVGLHLLYLAYSWVIILIKLASFHPIITTEYATYMFFAVVLLGAYAIFWQKVIRTVDLSVAYPQKGVVVFWTMLWSYLLWGDRLTPMNIVGSLVIIAGIAFVVNKHD